MLAVYLSDLAVDVTYQRSGIGLELIRMTQGQLHPKAKVFLQAAPDAVGYYPKIGMVPQSSAWMAPASPPLAAWA